MRSMSTTPSTRPRINPSAPRIVQRLQARREHHRSRGILVRAAFVVAGVVALLGGVAMLVLPGPAFVVIPVGLAILSLEFAWAERLLDRSLEKAASAQQSARAASPGLKLLAAVAGLLALAAFVVLAVLYDIPVLPV